MIQLKKNQSKLYEALKQQLLQAAPMDEAEMKDKKRGKLTTWQVKQFKIEHLDGPGQYPTLRQKWPSIERLLVIEKTVVNKSGWSESALTCTSFRVSNVTNLTAKDFAEGIRGHWGIENRNHWVRDVILGEDDNRIKHTNGAISMAVFNSIAINFLRQTIDDSIKYAQILFGQNLKELFPSIRT